MSRAFPTTRMRCNRAHPFVRNLTRENELTVNDLIYPMFVIEGVGLESRLRRCRASSA